MSEQMSSRRDQILLFAKNFVKHPRMLGSLIPSSRFLIRQVLSRIDWDGARLLVEYGPGVGTFTTEILARMHADARLIVVETNADFVRFLRDTIDDPRLEVLHESAADVGRLLGDRQHGLADYIVSGIPFSTMPPDVRDSILEATHDALKPSGEFLVYQFSPSIGRHLERVFHTVERRSELRNVLPATLFFCTRRPEAAAQSTAWTAKAG